jgi:hypothetical protein
VTGCPGVTKGHGKVVQRVYAEYRMTLNGHRAQRICILCEFLVVILSTVEAQVCADLIDNLSCLLTNPNGNFGDDFCQMVSGGFRDIRFCEFAQITEEIVDVVGDNIVDMGAILNGLREIFPCFTHCLISDPVTKIIGLFFGYASLVVVIEGNHELAGDVVGMFLERFDERSLLSVPLIDDLVQGGVGVLVLVLCQQLVQVVEKVFAFVFGDHNCFPPKLFGYY